MTAATAAAPRTASVEPDTALDDLASQLALDADLRRLCRKVRGRRRKGETPRTADEQTLAAAEAFAEAAGLDLYSGKPLYSVSEVLSWSARAVEMGCLQHSIGESIVASVYTARKTPNARLREEYERQAATGEEALMTRVAEAIAESEGGTVDTTLVLRTLGIEPRHGRDGALTLSYVLPYDRACVIADVLGVEYQAVGL